RDTRYGIRDTGGGIRDTGYEIRDTGYGIRDTGRSVVGQVYGIFIVASRFIPRYGCEVYPAILEIWRAIWVDPGIKPVATVIVIKLFYPYI
ncbi:MAG: hypothetical protein EA353_02125, partial [Puniceicoccaceae bacterium]